MTSSKKKLKKRVVLQPFESTFGEFTECLHFELNNSNVGGFLLRKKAGYKIVFGFSCHGFNNIMSMDTVSKVYFPLIESLIDFPEEESMLIHQQKFGDSNEREAELYELAEKSPSAEVEFLILSELKALKDITEKKLRQQISLDLYCTYTISKDGKKREDIVEKLLQNLEKTFAGLIGEKQQEADAELNHLLNDAFYYGFEPWKNHLDSLGLICQPHDPDTIWQKLTQRFTEEAIPRPQTIHITDEGLELSKTSDLNPLSRIFLESPVPVAHEKYIESKGKLLGVCSLEEKADGSPDARAHLQYLWKLLARAEVYDTEVFAHITKGDAKKLRENMRRLAQQAERQAEESEEKKEINFAADKKIEKAMAAGKDLFDDKQPFKTAVVIIVHRQNFQDLERAHAYLKSKVRSPLKLTLESTYPHEIWQQTFPISWQPLLYEYNRRNNYTNAELPGILPLVQPFSTHTGGIEFLNAEGGKPIYYNPWQNPKHLLMLATSRAGKGIYLGKQIAWDLAHGIPTSIIDYPNDDGTGTYTDYAEFFGDLASYYSPERETINILGIPDLSTFRQDPREIERRMDVFKEGKKEILEVMVTGANPHKDLDVTTISALLSKAVEYFYSVQNEKIYRRFQHSFLGGFGSSAWNNTPTLQDFYNILGFELLGIEDPSTSQTKMMRYIKLRLDFWLNSKIGKSLSQPSSIDARSLLSIYALTKLSNPNDAAVMAIAINQEAERKSMASLRSSIVVDEFSIQVENEAIAKMVARKAASGLKAGIRLTLAGQSLESTEKSPHRGAILDNINNYLIGLLAPSATESIIRCLKIEPEIIEANTSQKFHPVKHLLASNWLLSLEGHLNHVRYHADSITLAATANNSDEVARRAEILQQYADRENGKFIGLHAYAEEIKARLGAT